MRMLSKLVRFLKPRPLDPEVDLPNKEGMIEIYKEINIAITKAYENPTLHQLYKSVPLRFLLDTAINFYVGSRTSPKNPIVVELLFREAQQLSSNKSEELDVLYYQNYLKRLDAVAAANSQAFDQATDSIFELAKLNHPNALFMLGKEMYKIAHNMLSKEEKKQRLQIINQAVQVLNKSIQLGCFSALYTLGLMFQEGDIGNKRDLETAFNYFLISAAFDNPYGFFKLSQYYKEGIHVKKDLNLYYRYLKKAAQMGVIEAQHNLAIEYLSGSLIKKNEMKAFAWFIHAGQLGFPHSKYNAAMMLLDGTEDGKIQPNLKAALIKFQEVQEQGQIDATEIIKKLSAVLTTQAQKSVQIKEDSSQPISKI